MLAAGDPVELGGRVVAKHEPVGHELRLDAPDRRDHARIVRRDEPDVGEQEQVRVDRGPAVELDERTGSPIDAVPLDLRPQFVPNRRPALRRPVETTLDRFDTALERGPQHGP